MADAVIYHVTEKVSVLLIQEIDFISDVKEDIERLQAELKRMQCFLKDADRKQGQDERVRNWIAEIRELAYDADDVIDTFLVKIASGKVGALSFVHKYTTKFLHLHKISNKIKSIHVKLADISNSLQTYGIKFVDGEGSSSASETRRRLRITDPDEDEDVISLESTTKDLMAQLMKTKDHLRVVSIVGMGGLGKTTLAKRVYNSIDMKHHFDCYAWAFISQEFCLKDVVSGILLQIGAPSQMVERKSVDNRVRTLKNMLKGKRYLVVLDDIWKEEAWDSLKCAFPKGKNGSKILFTTRIREVALYADPRSSPVELPLLTYEEGWKLLSNKSFLEDSEDKQSQLPEFEKLGMEMVKKCGGLPLAIIVLGGLLANKSLKEWEAVQRDINSQFSKLQQRSQYAGVEWILALSYDDLPFRLKPCFLYLSQFPEDYEIHKKRLIRMWIAEGFIPKPLKGESEETIEDVGEQMLEELVNRSMIEVSQRDHTGTGVKTFRMHDLMRDMCLLKAREENFIEIVQNQGTSSVLSPSTRRIAVHSESSISPQKCSKGLRSFLYLVRGDRYVIVDRRRIQNFKMLRVLNLQNVNIVMAKAIGNLIHLRHLGLENSRVLAKQLCKQSHTGFCVCFEVTILPASIRNLKSLHTLDLRIQNYMIVSSHELRKLESLRHLLKHPKMEFRLDILANLETLKWVLAKDLIRKDAMLKLTNLRDLAIQFENREEIEVVLQSPIFGLSRLRSLKMKAGSFQKLELLSKSINLTKLSLGGAIPEDQSLKFLPESLTKLTLYHSLLKQDPVSMLERLPNLRYLSLENEAYTGSKIICSAHCFQQLESLELANLQVEEWEIEEGAMPCLKKLILNRLLCLRMIPEGLETLSSLREFTLYDTRKNFVRRVEVIDGVEGEDFHKVRHIPSVSTYNY